LDRVASVVTSKQEKSLGLVVKRREEKGEEMEATKEKIREEVRSYYGAVADASRGAVDGEKQEPQGCCAPPVQKSSGCCAPPVQESSGCCVVPPAVTSALGEKLGYRAEELESVPEGSNLGLGCGNPHLIASLKTGEVVLDLGSGAGFDAFLAARQVGEGGRVIGVDMTPSMLERARENARLGGYPQVEFREGLIESLPVEDDSVDVIISNCVINLSPDKPQVFREAYRVLREGGRLAISDVVALRPLPEEMRAEIALIAGCVGQASLVEDLEKDLREAGFSSIAITMKPESRELIALWFPERKAEEYVASAFIEARK
jgi:SAM-dependent methyltransferase